MAPNVRWTQAPPIQPGWYWYRDLPYIAANVLRVDKGRLAWGVACNGAEIEKLPGEWWSELLHVPV